ncbi:MAG TPA: hypothetical protein PLO23_04790 [Alphaproteobacteria bacterium]|nr:hypothetical protein [Alphaproteobacteria bacterium]
MDASAGAATPPPSITGGAQGGSKLNQCGDSPATGYAESNTPQERAEICRQNAANMQPAIDTCPAADKKKSPDQKHKDPDCKKAKQLAEKSYKQAAGEADNNAQKRAICSEAKEKLKSKSEKWKECAETKRYTCATASGSFTDSNTPCAKIKPEDIEPASGTPGPEDKGRIHDSAGQKNPLVRERARFGQELEDKDLRDKLNSQIEKEVGSQGRDAQRAYIESVLNRTAAGGTGPKKGNPTLRDTITDKIYYPKRSLKQSSTYNGKYDDLIDEVIYQGTNTCQYCTGNASGSTGVGDKTVTIGGEKFGVEDYNYHRTWVKTMRSGY